MFFFWASGEFFIQNYFFQKILSGMQKFGSYTICLGPDRDPNHLTL